MSVWPLSNGVRSIRSLDAPAPSKTRIAGTRRRVEKERVVAPALGGEEDRGLERPAVGRGARVVGVQLKNDAVTEPFIGVEVERGHARDLEAPARAGNRLL